MLTSLTIAAVITTLISLVEDDDNLLVRRSLENRRSIAGAKKAIRLTMLPTTTNKLVHHVYHSDPPVS